jgi:hypothetical protein
MLDRITGMQVFSRAAHAGSLSAAARLLSLSPGMATWTPWKNGWARASFIGARASSASLSLDANI